MPEEVVYYMLRIPKELWSEFKQASKPYGSLKALFPDLIRVWLGKVPNNPEVFERMRDMVEAIQVQLDIEEGILEAVRGEGKSIQELTWTSTTESPSTEIHTATLTLEQLTPQLVSLDRCKKTCPHCGHLFLYPAYKEEGSVAVPVCPKCLHPVEEVSG